MSARRSLLLARSQRPGIIGGNPVAGISTAGSTTQGYAIKDPNDAYGSFYYGLGVAPGIRIGATRFYNLNQVAGTVAAWTKSGVASICMVPGTYCVDTSNPQQVCPAVVQNHSHNQYDGLGTNAGVYTLNSREFDISVRDANRDTALLEPLSITMSAGNFRQDNEQTTMVMAAGTAKNVITMGGTESARSTAIPSACINGPYAGGNPALRHSAAGYDVLAYFSRRGTVDSRLKPDLVAPASQALGPSSYITSTDFYCATAGNSGQPNFPQYNGTSGTSFAAPVAAGAIALLRYYSPNLGFASPPSPAMYKAMLVAGARSITGAVDRLETHLRGVNYTVQAWPNTQQGFGMINLTDLLSLTPTKKFVDQTVILTQGQMYERTVTVSDPTKPVRIVLAWTDVPAAAGATITLVNNLDLTATWPDFYRLYGNYTDTSGWSRTSGGCGRPSCASPTETRNNVEVLNINPSRFVDPANHTFTIRIMAGPLNGISVPAQSGGANNQDFALFVLNGTM